MNILLFILFLLIILIGIVGYFYYKNRRYEGYNSPEGDVYVNFV